MKIKSFIKSVQKTLNEAGGSYGIDQKLKTLIAKYSDPDDPDVEREIYDTIDSIGSELDIELYRLIDEQVVKELPKKPSAEDLELIKMRFARAVSEYMAKAYGTGAK